MRLNVFSACTLILVTLAACQCTQAPLRIESPVEPMPQGEYSAMISQHTQGTNQYSGFYQTFQADVTILTTEVESALIRQRASFKGWDQKQYQLEREKTVQEASAYSKFFLRFFTPDHDYDDLNKPKTIWKIYLEFGGSRFEGQIKKMANKVVEIQSLYPYMDRFSTPYEVTFNVPMTTVEQGAAKVILTSSLGTAEFNFPKK